MAQFKESEHPRDSDGKFTYKRNSAKIIKDIGNAIKQHRNKRLNIPLDYFGTKNNVPNVPSEKKIPNLPSEAFGFGSKELLNSQHHIKHMRDMGFDNPKEYEKSAINFWSNGDGDVFYSHTRKRFHKYNEKRGIMLVISPDGTIHTFYQVKPQKFKAIMLQERLEKWKK